jgi:hypothetical protein
VKNRGKSEKKVKMENKKLFSTFWGRSWEFGRQKWLWKFLEARKQ